MIDTVKLAIPITLTEKEISAINWTRTNSSSESRKGRAATTIFKILHEDNYKGSPFIRYTYRENDLTECWLKVEVSIPTFLNGTNVYELVDGDIDIFFIALRKYVSLRLKIPMSRVPPIDQCTVEKVHVCKNFNVGALKQCYLKAMSTCSIAKYQLRQYGVKGSDRLESVEWKATKRKEKLYDKEAEMRQQSDYPEKSRHQKKAIGVLRYEIELSDDEIRHFSPIRRAVDVLTFDIAAQILQKGLERNGLSSGVKYTSLQQVIDAINHEQLPLITKSSLIAFVTEFLINGEAECREKYAPSTFVKRKSQISSILGVRKLLIGDMVLPPLCLELKKTTAVLAKQV